MLSVSAAGCSASPSQDLFGSYFPSWMLCVALGVLAAAACHVVLAAVRLDKALVMAPLAYLALAAAVALFTWLARFGQ